MPTSWVPPEEFVAHNEVTIYHVYKDDDADQGMRDFWYTTSEGGGEGSEFEFDVRMLPDYDEKDHEGTIKRAIDAGLLMQDEKPKAGRS